MSYKEKLDIIQDTINDTHFVLSREKGNYQICLYLKYLIISYLLISAIIFVYVKISQLFNFWGDDLYFLIYRFQIIFFYILVPFLYFRKTFKDKLSLNERYILNVFSLIPILIGFNMVLFPILYYIDANWILFAHETIPLESIAMVIGAFILFAQFKNKRLLINVLINVIYIALFILIKSYLNHADVLPETAMIIIRNSFSYISVYNVISIVSLVLMYLILMKRKKNDPETNRSF